MSAVKCHQGPGPDLLAVKRLTQEEQTSRWALTAADQAHPPPPNQEAGAHSPGTQTSRPGTS